MLVTFSTDNYANITLFGNVAEELLALMGVSKIVPGVILAKDVPGHLNNLLIALYGDRKRGLSIETGIQNSNSALLTDDKKPSIGIWQRALPLVALMEVAMVRKNNVMWR